MLTEIPNARFLPCMDSFLGSWAGVLRALDDERPMEDLWGLSGLGLRMQIHRALLPVGLLGRKWDETCSAIANRTGYAVAAGLRDLFYTPDDVRQIRLAWIRTIGKALDDGRPAISFGMHGPAFGIIYGYDEQTEDYAVSTFLDGQIDAPVNGLDLGSEDPPLIFVLIPTGPLADFDVHAAAREAIKGAIDQHLGQEFDAKGVRVETPMDLVDGTAAYNAWSAAIETGRVAQHWSLGYYAGYYAEARSAASVWLSKLTNAPEWSKAVPELNRAAQHLEHEADCFGTLSGLFPMQNPETFQKLGLRADASACLGLARAEHIAAMEALIEALAK